MYLIVFSTKFFTALKAFERGKELEGFTDEGLPLGTLNFGAEWAISLPEGLKSSLLPCVLA